jgi:hypothetical protein
MSHCPQLKSLTVETQRTQLSGSSLSWTLQRREGMIHSLLSKFGCELESVPKNKAPEDQRQFLAWSSQACPQAATNGTNNHWHGALKGDTRSRVQSHVRVARMLGSSVQWPCVRPVAIASRRAYYLCKRADTQSLTSLQLPSFHLVPLVQGVLIMGVQERQHQHNTEPRRA